MHNNKNIEYLVWKLNKMLLKFCKIIAYCAAIELINRLIFGGSKDNVEDTIVGKILIGDEEINNNAVKMNSTSTIIALYDEINSIDFEANMAMGVKRKSDVAGQIFDYLRLPGIISKFKII